MIYILCTLSPGFFFFLHLVTQTWLNLTLSITTYCHTDQWILHDKLLVNLDMKKGSKFEAVYIE